MTQFTLMLGLCLSNGCLVKDHRSCLATLYFFN